MKTFKEFVHNSTVNENCSSVVCACCDYFPGCKIYSAAREKFGSVNENNFACVQYANKDKHPDTTFVVKPE